jgi:hypothetical protein
MRKTYLGLWHIKHMEQWDEDYCNMEVQAYIQLKRDGTGYFQFGLVQGEINWWEGDASEECEFTWAGSDECDEASGSGSLRVEKDGSATGEMHLHMGDSSDFAAIRAPK